MRGGAKPRECAEVVGVCRTTVTGWVNHHVPFITEVCQRRQQRSRHLSDLVGEALVQAVTVVRARLDDLAAAVALLRPRWFRSGLVAAAAFHVGVILLLNIAFTSLLIVYIAILLPGLAPPIAERITGFHRRHQRALLAVAVGLAVAAALGNPLRSVVLRDMLSLTPVTAAAVELIGLAAIVAALGAAQKSPPPLHQCTLEQPAVPVWSSTTEAQGGQPDTANAATGVPSSRPRRLSAPTPPGAAAGR
jgi:hypothetical protein